MRKPRGHNPDGTFETLHGMKGTRLYRVWCAMRARCNNPHTKSYGRYGGRGIKVCEAWDSFSAFMEWAMSAGYSEGLTIDRIDCDGNYEPGNCRWATTAQQNRNYSRNHLITYNGKTQCIADWADETGINGSTILYRINSGKTGAELFDKTDGRTKRWITTSSSC